MTNKGSLNLFKRKERGEKALMNIPIGRILPNPASMRNAANDDGLIKLADSIMRYGVIQPLIVRPISVTDSGRKKRQSVVYELICGERRIKGAKLAGLSEVPCVCVEANDRLCAEMTLVENIGREDISYFEEAEAMASLIDVYGLSTEETAGVFGTTRSAVSSKLRLLKLSYRERLLISTAGLSEKHARAVLKICDAQKRLEVLKEASRLFLTVSQTEELVDKVLYPSEEKPSKRKIGIKDTRIVYNTIEKAIESIERNGIPIEKERRENTDTVEFVIRVKKQGIISEKTKAESA